MKVNYRSYARQALEQAQHELQADGDARLRSAALQLRMAMEALTYDRAQAYRQEIPPEELATWQPRKVMQLLLEIEPTADKSYTLRVGEEPSPGVAPARMVSMGTDTVFDLAALRAHYDAVGSILHMPTMQQVEAGKPLDSVKWRRRCEKIIGELKASLDSPVWNCTFGTFASTDCLNCGKKIRKRWSSEDEPVHARCFHCGAEYTVTETEEGQVYWNALSERTECQTEDCSEVFEIWRHEIKAGTSWQCRNCKQGYRIGYAIYVDAAPSVSG